MESKGSPLMRRGSSSKDLPFYEVPEDRLTPSKIVSEAKNAIGKSTKVSSGGNDLRPISTKRPDTPRESQRRLFGDQSIRDPTNRPPSSFTYVDLK